MVTVSACSFCRMSQILPLHLVGQWYTELANRYQHCSENSNFLLGRKERVILKFKLLEIEQAFAS